MTSEKKRVAIIIGSLNLGGAEKSAAILSRLLSKRGYEVFLLIDSHSGGVAYPYQGKIAWISNLQLGDYKKNLYYRAYYLKNLKKELKIDISISFMEDYNFINMMSDIGDKKVVSIRTYLSSRKKEWPEKDKVYHREIPKWYNKADWVVTMTEMQAKDLTEHYGVSQDKICIVPNIVDSPRMRPDKVPNLPENSIVTIGRLIDVKAQWHSIRAMSEVLKKVPNSHLYLLGNGDNYDGLSQLVKKMGLEQNIHFEGFTSNTFGYLKQAKILVHTPKVEGFVNALLDGFGAGTSVVCSDVQSSPRELLAPGTEFTGALDHAEYALYGILVPKPDEDKNNYSDILTSGEKILANVLIDLLSNEELLQHYREKAAERAKDFSEKKVISKWIECIEG